MDPWAEAFPAGQFLTQPRLAQKNTFGDLGAAGGPKSRGSRYVSGARPAQRRHRPVPVPVRSG